MADGLDISQVLQRALQANARFYKGWLDLSLEYMRGITEIFGGADAAAFTAPFATPATPAQEPEPGPGVLVIEGEEGTTLRCAFLVTNDLGRKLSCELVSSGFTGPDGVVLDVPATFDPAKLELQPGEQRVVHALVPVDARLPAGVAHSGAFALRGMDGFAVPVVLRRRHGVDTSSAPATEAIPKAAARPAAAAGAPENAPRPAARRPPTPRRARPKP